MCTQCFHLKTDNRGKRGYNLESHIAFINYVKASDKVTQNKLWQIMQS
jgi:hypothetical protein